LNLHHGVNNCQGWTGIKEKVGGDNSQVAFDWTSNFELLKARLDTIILSVYKYFLRTNAPFTPPKPKELDSATSTVAFRASLGT
jgi:hypothetical protein